MGFTASLERRSSPENPTTNLANPASWLAGALGGGPATSGVNVTAETAMKFTAVYACVRILAETLASVPLHVYRRLEKGRGRAPEHPMYRLLHNRPNPEMTSFTYRETLQAHLALWGNCYAEKEFNKAGELIALWPLLPDRTRAVRLDGRKFYLTRVGSQEIPLGADRVLHIPGLGFDGLMGYSPIAMAKNAIGLGLAEEEFGARFFGNGARASGFLTFPTKLSKEQEENIRTSWDTVHGGLSNAHRVAVLEAGLDWKQISIAPDEAQFLESRKFQINEIARFYRIPPHMLADLDRSTNNNIEHQGLEFVTNTMLPWFTRWEQTINWDLFHEAERDEYYAEFLADGLKRGDQKTRYESYALGRQWGWFSANDVLEKENENPIEGGDMYLVPLNMVPANQPPAPKEPAPKDGSPVTVTGEGSARRSRVIESRRRQQLAYLPLFRQAAAQVLRGEAAAVRRALKKSNGARDATAFRAWMGEYYERHATTWADAMAPALSALGESMEAEVIGEIGCTGTADDQLAAFCRGYTEAFGAREAQRSSGALQKVLRDRPDDADAAIEQLVARWEADRAIEIAAREVRQATGALVRTLYQAQGAPAVRVVAGACVAKHCRSLDGRVVPIGSPILRPPCGLDAGDGSDPVDITRELRHPPFYDGCDCSIVAELAHPTREN
jgi:HK97 family phage portal protein